jgi:23S rRNA U2552 (ribose-2'-O)-methylase RlmE/FtsJ
VEAADTFTALDVEPAPGAWSTSAIRCVQALKEVMALNMSHM